jgi:hypothetical protein
MAAPCTFDANTDLEDHTLLGTRLLRVPADSSCMRRAEWRTRRGWSSCAIGAPNSPMPVASVLVHRAFESMNALGEDREETIHDSVPLFGTQLHGELHRSFHVGEENRHLLPLALQSASRGEDLLGEMLGRVGARVRGLDRGGRLLSETVAARVAKAILR